MAAVRTKQWFKTHVSIPAIPLKQGLAWGAFPASFATTSFEEVTLILDLISDIIWKRKNDPIFS
jgi:hypothetical protein